MSVTVYKKLSAVIDLYTRKFAAGERCYYGSYRVRHVKMDVFEMDVTGRTSVFRDARCRNL